MCYDHAYSSAPLEVLKERLSEESKRKLEDAEKRFQELCQSGAIFSHPPMPVRVEDLMY